MKEERERKYCMIQLIDYCVREWIRLLMLLITRRRRAMVPMEVVEGVHGLQKVILNEVNHGSSAEVYLYGGQVTSWKNSKGQEMLFLSSDAIIEPPKAICGGIPICFPQFSGIGPLKAEDGFVRNRFWRIEDNPPPPPLSTFTSSDWTSVDLIFMPNDLDFKIWRNRFEFRLKVCLSPSGDLLMIPRIKNINTNGKSFSFTFAFLNYIKVSDISEVRIEGLETHHYLDNLNHRDKYTEQETSVSFESEVDKIYLDTNKKFLVMDHQMRRTVVIRKLGLDDAVLWNPWEIKAKEMEDFGDGDYEKMICIGPAAAENPIKLRPGQEWIGRQELSVVYTTYGGGEASR